MIGGGDRCHCNLCNARWCFSIKIPQIHGRNGTGEKEMKVGEEKAGF